jgi:hypothetical protein
MQDAIPVEPVTETPIDPALTDKVGALRALTTTYNLLNEGLFQKMAWTAVNECQEFIKSLHTTLTNEATSHPDADRIPDLKAIKEKKNGQT